MIRKAFVMAVNPGSEEEYRRRHAALWPDLRQVLLLHGVKSYSIFLHPTTHQLFAYLEIEDEARWAEVASTPECRRWWAYMAPLMPHNADHSPTAVGLDEVFHLT
jgi:L-rhamnose mutarotase